MVRIPRESEPGCAEEAARLLRQGELICYPTDTIYGVGAAAGDEEAVRRLFAVKGRPLDKPMPLLIADAEQASRLARVTPLARALMGRFWPGGLTIVLPKAPRFQSAALAGQEKVALRIPDQPTVRQIIRLLGEPITGTSANRAGEPSPTSAAEAVHQLGDMVALVIDGGPSPGRQESTVVDITEERPLILRQGAVSREELEEALGRPLA